MRYLIIDTVLDTAVYAIRADDKDYIQTSPKGDRHSESALKYIDKVLCDAGLTLKDIDVFGINVGPGSFTGVRIGMSILKGFLAGTSKKVVAYNSLEVIGYKRTGTALIRASRDDYFAGDAKCQHTENIRVLTNEEVSQMTDCFEESEFDPITELDLCEFKYKQGELTDINQLAPIYLKLSQAERQLKEVKDVD